DSAHSQLEHQLQQIKIAKITAEADVDQTRRKQNDQDWLEEDSNQLTEEKRVFLDFLRSGWQVEEASGFHRYLEERQHEESQALRRDLQ
ncbi:ribonuclease P, partial [Listeria monocytogenes]|nr:ribonuclease P [Listeria monocytogenes]